MSALLDELSKMARTLAQEECAQLVQELMESTDQQSDPEVAQAWRRRSLRGSRDTNAVKPN